MNSGRRIIVTGFALLLAWATLVAPISAKPHAGCVLAAELSVELVCQGAMASCISSPNPIACGVAAACRSSAASSLVKMGVAGGCSYVVEVVEGKVKFTIRGEKKDAAKMKEAYETLKSVRGVRWLQTQTD